MVCGDLVYNGDCTGAEVAVVGLEADQRLKQLMRAIDWPVGLQKSQLAT